MGYKAEDLQVINERLSQAEAAGVGFMPRLNTIAARFFVESVDPFVSRPLPGTAGVYAEEFALGKCALVGFSPRPRWDDDHAAVMRMQQTDYGVRCDENLIADAAAYVEYYPDRAVYRADTV